MISNLFDKNLVKVLTYFLISPGSKYKRNELKGKTEMNNVPFDNSIISLLSLKIIKEENNLYGLNFSDENINNLLEILKKEYLSFNVPHKIFNILVEVSEKISKIRNIEEAKLFGSYAKLIYKDKSDIDIAVILKNYLKNKAEVEKKIKMEISKISKKNKIEIEAHFFVKEDMKKTSDPLIKEIIQNGKKIF